MYVSREPCGSCKFNTIPQIKRLLALLQPYHGEIHFFRAQISPYKEPHSVIWKKPALDPSDVDLDIAEKEVDRICSSY